MAEVPALRALSVRRPWAQLIATGAKRIENRTWSTDYRGPILIHASKAFEDTGVRLAARLGVVVDPAACATGYLAVVDLIDVHRAGRACGDPWAMPDHYHWVLANPRRLPEVVPGPGRLGLYHPPTDVLAHIEAGAHP